MALLVGALDQPALLTAGLRLVRAVPRAHVHLPVGVLFGLDLGRVPHFQLAALIPLVVLERVAQVLVHVEARRRAFRGGDPLELLDRGL